MATSQRGSGPESDGTYVALLRGINVGGKNKLPMKDLMALFGEAGCTDVQAYIQSGNLVFRAPAVLAPRVPVLIERAIRDRFGFSVPVVTRTAEEIGQVARANPFVASGGDVEALHVAFLADHPSDARVATLDPDRSAPDQFEVRGREVYLHLPNGVARSKLTNQYFDSRLATVSTVRNWRTVLKLVEMTTVP